MTDLIKKKVTICALAIGICTECETEEQLVDTLAQSLEGDTEMKNISAALHGTTADFIKDFFENEPYAKIYHKWIQDNIDEFPADSHKAMDIVESEWKNA